MHQQLWYRFGCFRLLATQPQKVILGEEFACSEKLGLAPTVILGFCVRVLQQIFHYANPSTEPSLGAEGTCNRRHFAIWRSDPETVHIWIISRSFLGFWSWKVTSSPYASNVYHSIENHYITSRYFPEFILSDVM